MYEAISYDQFVIFVDLLNDWLETTSTGNDISDPNVLYNKVNNIF